MFSLQKILQWFRRNLSLKDWGLILIIIILFLATRLILLDKFPIFTDEGIYINWAKIAKVDASWRFISLTDGKQPLQTWFTIFFLKFFPDNPLLAGRLFAVLGGAAALKGLFFLSWYLFGKKAAFWSAFLYIFTPFFLFYDRLALVDSFVNAGFIWILFLSILLAKNLRLDFALIFGLASGMFSLSKSSIRMFVALSLLSPILFLEKNVKNFFNKLLNFSALYIIVIGLTLLIYNVQRLSPFLHYVAEKNKTFVMTFSEFLQSPFLVFFHNFKIIPWYIFWESGFILPLIGVVGLFFLFKKNLKVAVYLTLWIILPYLIISLFGKVVYPRYLNFFATLLLILATYFFVYIKNKKVIVYIVILLFASFIYFDYPILFNQSRISFPEIDRIQYIEGVSSGYGLKEIVDFSHEKGKEKQVVLLAEGNFGVVGDMLNSSLGLNEKSINVRGYWPLDKKNLIENQKDLSKDFVYIVFSHRTDFPKDWPMKFIKKFEKPNNKSAFYLFELTK